MSLFDKILKKKNIITDPGQMTEEELGKAQQAFRRKYRFRMFGKTTFSVILSIALIVGGIWSVFYYGIDVMTAYGTGMEPTIEQGSYIFINKLAYKKRSPKRGDVVVYNGRVGRIVGLPEEAIRLYGGRVYIGNNIADEAYVQTGILTYPYHGLEIFALGQQDYFILSDDRYSYSDSRDGTYASIQNISGRVIASINPNKLKKIFKGNGQDESETGTAAASGVPATGSDDIRQEAAADEQSDTVQAPAQYSGN